MGLRCLLGHDFGEPETERERNEEGNEVVVTVREVKTCERCGEKQVVSENKEITSIDQLRESAAGEASQEAPAVGGTTDAGGEWGNDDATPDQTEGTAPATTPEPESEQPAEESSGVGDDEDPIERGVADIIEQAEKDDDMLDQPPEESTADEPDDEAASDGSEDEDVPVHPGQRSAAAEESDSTDPTEDDGVILDDDDTAPPEEGRRQWEEEASPEDVPGGDLSVGEPTTSDDDDAEIIDAGGSSAESPTESTAEPSEPEQSTPSSAVESEDAEIVDAGPTEEPASSQPSPEPDQSPADAATEREETEEGHMPWPEGPGDDDGHDATPPEGEPADVDFSEFTEEAPDDGNQSAESQSPDRANGHRSDEGESSDQSTAPTANVDLERSSRDAELEYFCPECGLTRDVGTSSMRAGDICPECHVGYISEQQKAE